MIKILSKMKQPSVLLILLLLFSAGTAFAGTATAACFDSERISSGDMVLAIGFCVVGVFVFALTDRIIFFIGCVSVGIMILFFGPTRPTPHELHTTIKPSFGKEVGMESTGDSAVQRLTAKDWTAKRREELQRILQESFDKAAAREVQADLEKSSEEAVREAIEDMTSLGRRKITLRGKEENFNDPKAEVV